MKDTNGIQLKHGDKIKTERGVELDIEVENEIFFMLNTGNMKKRELSYLNVNFYKVEED